MSLELGGKTVPKPLVDILVSVRDRIKEIEKQYGSLSRWGRPYLTNIEEVATVFYVNEVLNVSLDRLSHWLGVDKTGLYKLVKRIKEEGKASVYDANEKVVKTLTVRPEDLKAYVDENILHVSTKSRIMDPFESAIIRRFWESKIEKRAKMRGHSPTLTENDKKKVIGAVRKLMEYIMKARPDYPTNPDLWDELSIAEIIEEMYEKGLISRKSRYSIMVKLRSVPEWRGWFEGRIGAVTKTINPVERVIHYREYLKLKEAYKRGELEEREFLVIALHVATGAREGWQKANTHLSECKSSLIGLKWENVTWKEDTAVVKIYESKTDSEWRANVSWLDPELPALLREYAKDKGSIIESITGIKEVAKFKVWYEKTLEKVSKLLNLPYKLRPHDLRRSSLSIKAELGIPLEYAVSDKLDFGVGWEDLKTAYIFYLRFSSHTWDRLIRLVRETQKEIEKQVS